MTNDSETKEDFLKDISGSEEEDHAVYSFLQTIQENQEETEDSEEDC
jgi:hypothetical protein